MNHIFPSWCLGNNSNESEKESNLVSNIIIDTPSINDREFFEKDSFLKDNVSLEGLIASGAYASVYKIYKLKSHENTDCLDEVSVGTEVGNEAGTEAKKEKKYVCKVCDCTLPDGFIGAFLREICILKHLSSVKFQKYNKNIVPLLDVVKDISGTDTIGLIMPRLKWSLHHYMIKNVNKFENSRISFIMSEILTGLQFIHHCGIIHRDIKPANILIDGEIVQICDFNLAKSFDGLHKLGSHTEEVVTAPYRAPEVWRKQRYSYPIDIWSVGVILLEIIMGKFMYKLYDSNVNNTAIMKRLLASYKNNYFYRIISQMLDFNQLTRITAINALKDPVFNPDNTKPITILPSTKKVVEILSNDLVVSLKKYKAHKEITKCLAGNIFRVTRCSPDNAALLAIKMCEDDIKAHFRLESYINAEFDILKKMNFNLVISGKSEYFDESLT